MTAKTNQARNFFKLSLLTTIVASNMSVAAEANKDDEKLIDEVVVVGTRSIGSAADALMEKKISVGVNAIMSAETIMEMPGGNITDILSTLPSVTAYADMGKGQAATGEAEFLSVRGIDSSYNAYLMNGSRMPQADSSTRALSLKMVAPYGLSSGRVSKTPTAKDPGDAVGAVIELSTPTGFSLGKDYAKVTLGANYSALADDRGFDSTGDIAQFEFADILGDNEEYGFYATAYHEKRYSVAETLEVGRYSNLLEADKDTDYYYDMQGDMIPTDVRFDFYNTEIERFGGSLSFDHKIDKGTVFLRANYGSYEATGSESQRKLAVSNSEYDADGNWVPLQSRSNAYFQMRGQKASLANLLIGGDYKLTPRLDLDYNLTYGESEQSSPMSVEGSLYSQPVDGAVYFNLSDPKHADITFSDPATEAYLTDPHSPRFRKIQGRDAKSKNTMYGAKFDITYTPHDYLDVVQTGLDFYVSDRDLYNRGITGNNGDNYTIPTAEGEPAGSSNPQGPYSDKLPGQNVNFMDGLFNDLRVYDPQYFQDFAYPVAFTDIFTKTGRPNPGFYTQDDYNRNTVSGTETVTALYVQSQKDIGELSITAGLRYEYTDFEADHWVRDQNNSRFVTDTNGYSKLLPNLNVSYRPNEEVVYRLAARRSFSRPAFSLIAGPESYSYNQNSDALERINRSNPDLEPVSVDNYDASVEWYLGENMVMEAAVYYKKFKNYIYTASVTGATPPAEFSDRLDGDITVVMPENGNEADLEGIELHARYQFDADAGWMKGFGADVTATFQGSNAVSADSSRGETDLPRSPKEIYSTQLFYQNDDLSAALIWQYTGRQLLSLTDDRLDKYLQANTQLNANVSYHFDTWTITAQVENLLDEETFHKTLGKGKQYLGTQDGGGNGSYVETGRTFKMFASYQF